MLEDLVGIGPKILKALNKLNINSREELFSYYPYRFDIIKRSNIELLNQDDKVIIDGIVERIPTIFFYSKKFNKMDFMLNTGNNVYKVIIFNRAFLKPKIDIGTNITIIGKYDKKHNTLVASDIKLSLLPSYTVIEPIYHVNKSITSKELNRLIVSNLENVVFNEYIPKYLIDRYKLIDKESSIKEIHRPTSSINLNKAINYLSNYQGTLMAPTEILAEQHYNNLLNLYKDTDIKVELLTGKMKVSEKKKIYKRLINNEIDILIGTHALFSDDVIYNNLGLVITDEQHRFGVNQRTSLKNKGITPDILYLSATPIPRTYAITLYGDMDMSSIHTRPNGRKEIITILKKNKEIKDVLDLMYQELKQKHQIYVIAPLIEDNDTDMENVYQLKEKMDRAFSKICVTEVLHGKMSSKEKDEVMEKYNNNEINILISTTVIEVGVDVKNATMIVIFDSYRFGLSQLHQLRGRVGRNELQSYCVLISDQEAERLNVLTKTSDGFKVSEEDFKLRGSGDLFGTRQSGDMQFKLADIKRDFSILLRAKEDSKEVLSSKEIVNNKKNNILNFLDKSMDIS